MTAATQQAYPMAGRASDYQVPEPRTRERSNEFGGERPTTPGTPGTYNSNTSCNISVSPQNISSGGAGNADNQNDASFVSPQMDYSPVFMNPKRLKWLQLKNKLNCLELSANPQFKAITLDLEVTAGFARKTVTDCKAYLEWLKTSPQYKLTGELNRFFKHPERARSQANEAAKEIKDFGLMSDSAQLSGEQAHKYYEDEVIAPIERWIADYNLLQPKIEQNVHWHLAFDHYSKKLASLQVAVEKIANTEKDTPAIRERLTRNSTKLKQARDGFESSNRQLVAEMQAMHEGRFDALAPVATSYVKFHSERTEAMTKRG